MGSAQLDTRGQDGFTLVELAVVTTMIGVLAALALPRFVDSVERSRVLEALNYLSAVRAAQRPYHARHGRYADDPDTSLDIKFGTPKYFTLGTIEAGSTGSLEDSWSLTLTRKDASAGYGEYTVVFTEEGFDRADSTIMELDGISPMGGSW